MSDGERREKPANIIHSETPVTGTGTMEILEMSTRITALTEAVQRHTERMEVMELRIVTAQHEHTQTLRTIMVGWNAFLKSAEGQVRALFKGNIPAPIKKKLLQTAFQGMEEAERKNK